MKKTAPPAATSLPSAPATGEPAPPVSATALPTVDTYAQDMSLEQIAILAIDKDIMSAMRIIAEMQKSLTELTQFIRERFHALESVKRLRGDDGVPKG